MENGTCFFKGHIPVRKGSSSVRVLSTPRARAIVDNFLILLSRSFKNKVIKWEEQQQSKEMVATQVEKS